MRAVRKLVIAATLGAFALTSCGPPPGTSPQERRAAAAERTQQRITDLVAINNALMAYHEANGAYPVSEGAQGFVSAYGASLGERWIPQLPADFALPRDPENSNAGNEPQYLYVSDGAEYKVIAHATDDCAPAVETQGVRIDPRRRSETSCWAYGFWSANGQAF